MKKELKPKRSYPRKYGSEVVNKVVSLIKEQQTLKEILSQVPCKKNCVRRIARKHNLVIKK